MTIQEILLNNKIKPCMKGFRYICYAVELNCKDNEMYKSIAAKYNTNYAAVERAMRYTIQQSNFAGICTKDLIERLKMLLEGQIANIN